MADGGEGRHGLVGGGLAEHDPGGLPPPDLGLVVDGGVRRLDGGSTLLGGSPLRILKLAAGGAALFDRWSGGEEVGRPAGRRRLARRLLGAGILHPRPAPLGPGSLSQVSVVVPVHEPDRGDLEAALASTAGCGQVVLVDDGSGQAGAAVVEEVGARHGAVVLHRRRNGGPGRRRTGLDAADRPIVVFLDADAHAEPGWLESLLGHFRDPAVAAVAPRVVCRTGGATVRERYEARHSPLDLGAAPARVAPRTQVAYVPTAALAVRREVLDLVGGFDERLRYGEDVDLVWRIVAAGGTVRYEPAVEVRHRPRGSWAGWARQRFGYGTAAAPLARRHPGQVPPLAVSGWSAVSWGAVGLGHPLVGLAVSGTTTALLPRKLKALGEPWREALRLAGWGNLWAGRWIARALTRTWWPLVLVGALCSRRLRWVLGAAALVPLADWRRDLGIDPARYVALRLADDVAYGAGVWVGCWRERTVDPLVPDLRSWPGRARAVEG